MRTTLINTPAAVYKGAAAVSAALPLRPDPLTYAARRIERRYNVNPSMARLVAEMLVGTSTEVRR
jgi:hypothetical protein